MEGSSSTTRMCRGESDGVARGVAIELFRGVRCPFLIGRQNVYLMRTGSAKEVCLATIGNQSLYLFAIAQEKGKWGTCAPGCGRRAWSLYGWLGSGDSTLVC